MFGWRQILPVEFKGRSKCSRREPCDSMYVFANFANPLRPLRLKACDFDRQARQGAKAYLFPDSVSFFTASAVRPSGSSFLPVY